MLPNFLFLIADDHRHDAIGSLGTPAVVGAYGFSGSQRCACVLMSGLAGFGGYIHTAFDGLEERPYGFDEGTGRSAGAVHAR